MFELLVGLGVCALMGKIADQENQSEVIWGGISFALCVAALAIPLPYVRFLIAGAVAFGLLLGYKILSNR